MKCRMDHIVLNVTDMEAMLAFYIRVLDLPAERLETYRAGQVPFPSVRLGADTVIDFFPEQMWAQQGEAGPCWAHLNHFCLALEKLEWDALVERLKKGGVAIESGPVERWGAHGTGISIYFRDPENNLIEVRYYERVEDRKQCLLGS